MQNVIYIYSDKNINPGYLKIGFTTRDVNERIQEQYSTALFTKPTLSYSKDIS